MTKLSVIIPFRCESDTTNYLIERLDELLSLAPKTLPIEFMVVDSGSSYAYQKTVKDICSKYSTKYLYHDTLGKPFSIGACRDFGVQNAVGDAVSFLDVDLRVADDFWGRLLTLMQAWGISKYKKSFLAIPCLYLTQEGTIDFIQQDPQTRFTDYYLRYLQGDKTAVENMALCSSVMVVDRIHYLSVGGHDIEFRGHGYEDFELYHRLLCEENIIPKTEDYYLDQKTWDTFSYTGFRSHLAIAARPAMMMNLFVVHLWHPRPKNVSFYATNSIVQNRTMWTDKFKKFVETGFHPEALSIKGDKVLFFGKPNTHASSCLRNVIPFLGKLVYTSEYNFYKNEEFLEDDFAFMLENSNIKKIIFPNPYGNPARLAIYDWCRKTGFPFYCYERGALPDSWFFDPNGFNADSISYSGKMWDRALSEDEQSQIENYIQECIFGSNFLEKQSDRIGGEALAHRLQLGSKKVLFVPLQRPSDTVIKYMSGDIQSYSKFIEVIDKLAKNMMSKGWVVLCKRHPLETESPRLQYAQYVPEDTHFIDLLELADRVALINSGVGVYSMMMEKPTFIFGKAFYADSCLNKTIEYMDYDKTETIENLTRMIVNGFQVDRKKMHRFLHYLVYYFYSFGKPKTISRKEADGSLRTITTGIDFYNLKIDGKTLFEYEANDRPRLALTAPLFERYALDIHFKRKAAAAKPAATPISKPMENKSNSAAPKVQTPPATPKPTSKPATPKPAETEAKKLSDNTKQVLENVQQYEKSKQDIKRAKMAKFKRDPYQFCADSKNPLIRLGKIFFSKN